jgi:chromosome segregation ATPase
VDYITELRAGAGVTEVARLRRKVDNLNGALQKTRGQNTSQATTIKKLNAIKANLEEQIKELSSQLAAANNRLQATKQSQRPTVHSYGDKGTGFGLGEVARFKGRPLDGAPVIEKKRARG